ncbi:MAG: hypothetical protein JW715_03555 [Sedimentisphaerales bacterium]|nr:hypothetical protein [Sedimentisphaerales bacterium]
MSNSDIQKILKRLDLLEKQNHNIKVISSLVLLSGMIGLFIWFMLSGVQKVQAQQTPQVQKKEVIACEGFVLVDSDGNFRARLSMETDAPSLTFLNTDGKVVCRLVASDRPGSRPQPEESVPFVQSNGLYFYNAAGLPRTSIELHNGLSVYDETSRFEGHMSGNGVYFSDGNIRYRSRVSLESNNGLRLYSEEKETGSLQARNGLRLYDLQGSGQICLQPWTGLRLEGSGRGGNSTLSIKCYDGNKKRRFNLNGVNGLTLYDAEGKSRKNSDPVKGENR